MRALITILMFIATFARAESIVVLYSPSAREFVLETAKNYGYSVKRERAGGAVFEIPDFDGAYAEFLLKIFDDSGVLRVHRKSNESESQLRFNLSPETNEVLVAEVISRLEGLGARVARISEDTMAYIDVNVSEANEARLRLELVLLASVLRLENIAQTHGTSISCKHYFGH